MIKVLLVALAIVLDGTSAVAKGAVLGADTSNAWREYVTAADSVMKARLSGHLPFLWTDEVAERRQRVLRGETVVAPVIRNGLKSVPGGLIHHWTGSLFTPNVTIRQFITVLHQYNRYKEFYRPLVMDSMLCSATPSSQEFAMILQYKVVFANLVFESQYLSNDFVLDARRRYSIADTIRVQEIEGYGTAAERRLPQGEGTGLVWGLHTIVRYEERDGGVYLELEALALSRSVPGALRWFVGPLIRSISSSSLEAALQKTRNAVSSAEAPTLEAQSESGKSRTWAHCNCTGLRRAGVAPSSLSK